VAKDLKENLFYKHHHQLIANAIIEMYANNQKIDIITVGEKLKTMGTLEQVGGVYAIVMLSNKVSSSANLESHILILKEKALRREIIRQCSIAIQKAYDDQEDVFDTSADLTKGMDDSLKDILNYEVSSVKDIHLKNIQESKLVAESGIQSGVECGLKLVDKLTGGWQDSDLVILAGRPSMGKTACALSMVVFPSIEKNKPVAIFSLEMSSAQIVGRIQSQLSCIDVSKVIKKQLDISDVVYMEKACTQLLTAPLYIDDTPNISLIELKTKARRLVRENKVELIVVDYLQLMRSGLNIQNREQEVAEISRGLKSLAKELSIPIIALSQLSRLVEGRTDKKPQLSDLRESGSLEQDADMVVFCYRPEYYGVENYEIEGDSLSTKGLFLLLVSKNRNGSLGEVPLRFVHSLAQVKNHPNWDKGEEQEVDDRTYSQGLTMQNMRNKEISSGYVPTSTEEESTEVIGNDGFPF
jgi:replicative DNA helicase